VSRAYPGRDPFSSESFRALQDFVLERLRGTAGELEDFEVFERGLHARMQAFEAEVVGARLALYDETAPEVEVDGTRYRRKAAFTKEYSGLAGAFKLERALYVPRDGGGGKAICPLELRAGLVEGYWTPLAARVMARAVSASTPREAAALFKEMGGMNPSGSSLDRLPKRLSEHWEENRAAVEDELRSQEVIPAEAVAVAVSLDGVLVPMKEEPQEGPGEEEKPTTANDTASVGADAAVEGKATGDEEASQTRGGPKGYREVGCGTVSFSTLPANVSAPSGTPGSPSTRRPR
jgi:hypothetical protein